jgi:GGDEF domain-containing protein
VLLTLAKRLTETTRTDDTISRHGGDEFLYLLMEVSDDQDAAMYREKNKSGYAFASDNPTPPSESAGPKNVA